MECRRAIRTGTATLLALALLAVGCAPPPAAAPAAPAQPPAAQLPAAQAAAAAQPAAQAPAGQTPAAVGPPDKVVFMAAFKPQANVSFFGAYVAQEKGYYREQNLDVEIKHTFQTGEQYKLLAANQLDVTTSSGEDIIKALLNDGASFLAIAMLTQRGDRGYTALAESGIRTPRDWEGKTVGYKNFIRPEYLALIQQAGVDRSKIREVGVGFDPRVLTEKRVDAIPIFLSNEPFLIRKMGYEVNVLDPEEYGLTLLGQTWIVNAEQLRAKGPIFERWLKASLQGLNYAFANEREALDIIMKYAPQEDREHQEFMLRTERERSITELTRQNGLGWMTADQWSKAQDMLFEYDQIKQKAEPSKFYTDQFLRAIYRNGEFIWP